MMRQELSKVQQAYQLGRNDAAPPMPPIHISTASPIQASASCSIVVKALALVGAAALGVGGYAYYNDQMPSQVISNLESKIYAAKEE